MGASYLVLKVVVGWCHSFYLLWVMFALALAVYVRLLLK
jgi:hypothetical protein